MGKSKVLVVGGTGYIGRRIVKASLEQGHETYVLQRPDIGLEIEKVQMLLSFKKQGAHLVEGSFSNHQSLVDAVKLVDVVICTMSGVHFRSHNLMMQLKLVEAIKDAGNVKVCQSQCFDRQILVISLYSSNSNSSLLTLIQILSALNSNRLCRSTLYYTIVTIYTYCWNYQESSKRNND
jgi:NAD(P)-dependent dehydrogenase (short-subunit alcohol dehydrogenase family)